MQGYYINQDIVKLQRQMKNLQKKVRLLERQLKKNSKTS